jgi:hypothetical protein
MGLGKAAKGQVLSTEIVVSFALFLAALLVYVLGASNMLYSYSEERADLDMRQALLGIADNLVLSPGCPADWEYSGQQASYYGLAESPNALSRAKLSAAQSLFSADYSGAKTLFGAGMFDLSVSVVDANGTKIGGFGKAASAANGTYSSASSERLAVLDGQLVRVRVQLWRQRGGAI